MLCVCGACVGLCWSLREAVACVLVATVSLHQPPRGCQVPALVPLLLLYHMPVVNQHLHLHHSPRRPHLRALLKRPRLFLRCLGLTIAVVLLLAFVERPSSLSLSSDPRRRSTRLNPPCGATEGVELVCLLIFCLDLAVKVGLLLLWTLSSVQVL